MQFFFLLFTIPNTNPVKTPEPVQYYLAEDTALEGISMLPDDSFISSIFRFLVFKPTIPY